MFRITERSFNWARVFSGMRQYRTLVDGVVLLTRYGGDISYRVCWTTLRSWKPKHWWQNVLNAEWPGLSTEQGCSNISDKKIQFQNAFEFLGCVSNLKELVLSVPAKSFGVEMRHTGPFYSPFKPWGPMISSAPSTQENSSAKRTLFKSWEYDLFHGGVARKTEDSRETYRQNAKFRKQLLKFWYQ